jgi:exodeoxyribonuclease VII large subunit
MKSTFLFKNKDQVFGVTELNYLISQLLKSNVPLLWVGGEISNLVKAGSGHLYFSLKDDKAQIRCVMFRHKNQFLKAPIANGQQVELLAVATLYEQRGDFQLTVEQVRAAGLGILYERFERLKQFLQDEGLFAEERKRDLPAFPVCIGVITSPQAAALRDVLSTLKKRLPTVPVVLYPTPVQGRGSAEKISKAISIANKRAECDVLIACRGGGSIEDLWAFNEEVVARAISASNIPIVSGVGHETDFTIADFVVDERAPTPTAAAQKVAPDRIALLKSQSDMAIHLRRAYRNRLQNAMQRLDFLQRRLVHPAQHLHRQTQRLMQMQQSLRRINDHQQQQRNWQYQSLGKRLCSASDDLVRHQSRYLNLVEHLVLAMRTSHTRRLNSVGNVAQNLTFLDPRMVLKRGYSLVQDSNGGVVLDARQVKSGETLKVTFSKGSVSAEVKGDS